MSRIFISLSHRGRGPEWKAALLRALAVFEKQHLLDLWESPQADLAAAEQLINDCGYHRRDEELADPKSAILGIT